MPVALHPAMPGIAHLRSISTAATDFRVMSLGITPIDGRLGAGGGGRPGALHEATARSASLADDAAATLFLAGIAAREAAEVGGLVL